MWGCSLRDVNSSDQGALTENKSAGMNDFLVWLVAIVFTAPPVAPSKLCVPILPNPMASRMTLILSNPELLQVSEGKSVSAWKCSRTEV